MAVPWTKIKAEWLKGGTTYKKLAEKYHLNEGSIKNRASKEGWQKEKLLIADKVSTELRGRIARTRVNHLERLINASELIITGVEKLAAEVAANPMKYLTDKAGGLRNVESITKALQTATETQMELYKIPNIDQAFARKKWNAEQRQLKAEAKELSGTVIRIITDEGDELDG